jgi:uncharacterized protein YggE
MIDVGRALAAALLGAALLGAPAAAQGIASRGMAGTAPPPERADRLDHLEKAPNLVVAGRGEARVAPDEATVRLGTLAQAATAGAAQQQVNRTVAAVLAAVRTLGVRQEQIQTSELSLVPVFSQRPVQPLPQGGAGEGREAPQIVGYQASNSVAIRLDKLEQVGPVIDAGLGGGANRLEGVTFGLHHDEAARQAALRDAVAQARGKAAVLASAMHVRLAEVLEVQEEGAAPPPPRFEAMRASAFAGAAAAGTPVASGQLAVSAGVIVRYRIAPCPAQGGCDESR